MARVISVSGGYWKVAPQTLEERNALVVSSDLKQKVDKEYNTVDEARAVADELRQFLGNAFYQQFDDGTDGGALVDYPQ